MAFAASLRSPRTFQLGYMRGHRAGTVDGLVTEVGQGLGGEALVLGGPLGVADYTRAPGITHQFDQAVAAEGLHAVFAVPVRVESELRGAVCGAVRRPLVLGDRFWRMVVEAVRAAVRVPRLDRTVAALGSELDVVLAMEEVRELRAVLRAAQSAVADPATRVRLDRLAERLSGCPAAAAAGPAGVVPLSARELEVLSVVALGCGNGEVAQWLFLSVETVKSYLKSAMAKLDSHTRREAVQRARRADLLP